MGTPQAMPCLLRPKTNNEICPILEAWFPSFFVWCCAKICLQRHVLSNVQMRTECRQTPEMTPRFSEDKYLVFSGSCKLI